MSAPTTCPFCDRIKAGDYDRQWSDAVAFQPPNPVTDGHVLVVPRRHVDHAAENPITTGAVMVAAAEMARALMPCNIITSVGPEATQTVKHLHVHVVPRRRDDGLTLPWTGQKAAS